MNPQRAKQYVNNLYENAKQYATEAFDTIRMMPNELLVSYNDRKAQYFLDKNLDPTASQAANIEKLSKELAEVKKSMSPIEYQYFTRSLSNAIPENNTLRYLEATRPDNAHRLKAERRSLKDRHLPTIEELEKGTTERFSTHTQQLSPEEKATVNEILQGKTLSQIENPALSGTVLQTAMEFAPLDTAQYVKEKKPEFMTEDFAYSLGVHTVYGMNRGSIEEFDQRKILSLLPKRNIKESFGVGIHNAERAKSVNSFKRYTILQAEAARSFDQSRQNVEARLNAAFGQATHNTTASQPYTLRNLATTQVSHSQVQNLFAQSQNVKRQAKPKDVAPKVERKTLPSNVDTKNFVPVQDKSSLNALIEKRRKKNPRDPSIKNMEFYDKIGRYTIVKNEEKFMEDFTRKCKAMGIRYHINKPGNKYIEKVISVGQPLPKESDCVGFNQLFTNHLIEYMEKEYGPIFAKDFKQRMNQVIFSSDYGAMLEQQAGFALTGREVTPESIKNLGPCIIQTRRYDENGNKQKYGHVIYTDGKHIMESTSSDVDGDNKNGVQISSFSQRMPKILGKRNFAELRVIPIGALVQKSKAMQVAVANGSMKQKNEKLQDSPKIQEGQSLFAQNTANQQQNAVEENYMAMR